MPWELSRTQLPSGDYRVEVALGDQRVIEVLVAAETAEAFNATEVGAHLRAEMGARPLSLIQDRGAGLPE
jgi:hypothetical protein